MTDPHFPALHRTHPRGWINDPNGIVRHGGRWHVFFQYNPDSARHHMIHWGHVSSPDLVTWREEPMGPAPRPGEFDADGCWSGVATIEDGAAHLVYSGVDGRDNQLSRVLVQRADADLSTLTPRAGTAADIPPEPGIAGVRDPFLLEAGGRRLAIQGAELHRPGPDGTMRRVPAILAWDRSDLGAWRYLGVALTGEHPVASRHAAPAHLWECPQLVPLRDEATGRERWVLTVGRWTEEAGEAALNGVSYLVGELRLDGDVPVLEPETGGVVDAGPDFYAPQAYVDGVRVLLWGWSWEGAGRTQEQTDEQGWAGCLTFPRELALAGGELRSRVPAELRALRGERMAAGGGAVELAHPARAEVRAQGSVRVELLGADGAVVRTVAEHADGPSTLFVDASILEVLPERGVPRTVRVHPESGERLRVSGEGLEAWELRSPQDR